MKTFEIRASLDMQFGHGVVKAGTLIGSLVMHEPVEPTSLLSMTQFHQATISEVNSPEPVVESLEPDQAESTTLAGDSDEIDDDSTDVFVDPSEETITPSDLADFLDESLIEALAANEITTKAKLLEFIDSGEDMTHLSKIGPTRAKKILAAVTALRETQQ